MSTYVDIPAVSSSGGTSASGSLREAQEAALSALLGAANLNSLAFMAMGEGNTSSWSAPAPSGTGTVATIQDNDVTFPALAAGGMLVLGTGTGTGVIGTNQSFVQTANFGGRPAVVKYDDPSRKFGATWIGNILSTPTADSLLYVGPPNWKIGVIGSISTTKFVLAIGVNQAASIVSTVSIDANQHTLKTWMEGTNAWFQVDSETPQSVSAIPLFPLNGGQLNSNPLLIANKTGNAVNHLIGTRLALWMCAIS